MSTSARIFFEHLFHPVVVLKTHDGDPTSVARDVFAWYDASVEDTDNLNPETFVDWIEAKRKSEYPIVINLRVKGEDRTTTLHWWKVYHVEPFDDPQQRVDREYTFTSDHRLFAGRELVR